MKASIPFAILALAVTPAVAEDAIDPALESVIQRLEAGVASQEFSEKDFTDLQQLILQRIANLDKADPAGKKARAQYLTYASELQMAGFDDKFPLGKPEFVTLRQDLITDILRMRLRHAKNAAEKNQMLPAQFATEVRSLLEQRRNVGMTTPATAAGAERNFVISAGLLDGMLPAIKNQQPPIIIDYWTGFDALVLDQHIGSTLQRVESWVSKGRTTMANGAPLVQVGTDIVLDRKVTAGRYKEIDMDQAVLTALASKLVKSAGSVKPADIEMLRNKVSDMTLRRALFDLKARVVDNTFSPSHEAQATQLVMYRGADQTGNKLNAAMLEQLKGLVTASKTRQLKPADFEGLDESRAQLLRSVVQANFSKK